MVIRATSVGSELARPSSIEFSAFCSTRSGSSLAPPSRRRGLSGPSVMESIAMTDALGQHVSPGVILLEQGLDLGRDIFVISRQVAAISPEHRRPGITPASSRGPIRIPSPRSRPSRTVRPGPGISAILNIVQAPILSATSHPRRSPRTTMSRGGRTSPLYVYAAPQPAAHPPGTPNIAWALSPALLGGDAVPAGLSVGSVPRHLGEPDRDYAFRLRRLQPTIVTWAAVTLVTAASSAYRSSRDSRTPITWRRSR